MPNRAELGPSGASVETCERKGSTAMRGKEKVWAAAHSGRRKCSKGWRRGSSAEPTGEQVYPEGLQPMERTHTGAGVKREEDGAEERTAID